MSIFAVPSKEVPAIVLAFAKAVAVAAFPVQEAEEPVVFWLSVATLAAATVPEDIFEAFVVSVVAEEASPSIVRTLAGVISSITPAPLESLPKILFVADTFCIFEFFITN